MSKAERNILAALERAGGHPSHCGTLADDTGYTIRTVNRIIDRLLVTGEVIDIRHADDTQWLQLAGGRR